MGCTPNSALTGITYDCDVPTGGLKRLFIGYKNGDNSNSFGFDDGVRAAIEADAAFTGQTPAPTALGIGTDTNSSNYSIPTGIGAISGSDPVFFELEFNRKDGFSNFTDVGTVNADGSKEVVPSIQVEIPKMSFEKYPELWNMTQGNVELIALVETAAGTYHLVGVDFGLYAGTLDGASGVGRTEKNRWQLTLTGSEAQQAVAIEDTAAFEVIATATV